MRNIKINEAESIFETFYDGGESYPEHWKYSCLPEYAVEANGAGEVSQGWASVNVVLYGKNEENRGPFYMERRCCLDIRDYDVFRMFATISANIRFRVVCCIDGVDTEVIATDGYDIAKEYTGALSGSCITAIRMEFENKSGEDVMAGLVWLGLSNSAKEKKMLEEESPYTEQWEGCFEENPEPMPQTCIYFDEKELEEIRKKVQTDGFRKLMDTLRQEAREAMDIVPEKEIGTYVHNNDRRWVRERDMGKPSLVSSMQKLAFVGIVDKDMDMLRMSCRMALSVAHCTYFCESIMGVMPGATWHHRSFTEESICKALVKVLDWAGGLLTWHGKNIIYDSIIIKGLPRLDADIKTMDYMWKMNQGAVFASGLVEINLALQKRYPRYSVRVEESERDLLTMWETYVQSDGGTSEGPAYWNYTAGSVMEAMYLLARYHGKPVEEYVPASVYATSKFAYAMLSDAGDYYVPLNDAHPCAMYSPKVVNFLARINAGEIWKVKNNRFMESPQARAVKNDIMNLLIYGQKYDLCSHTEEEEFINMPVTGHTTLRRQTPDLGIVGLHAISGLITFGHAHGDKGSFILEADGKALLIDRGVCSYNNSYTHVIANSELHNVLTAIKDGRHLCQDRSNPESGAAVVQAEYREGVFRYSTDVTPCWNGAFKKHVRSIDSPDPYHYVVEDQVELNSADMVCFILNTYGTIVKEGDCYLIEDSGVKLFVSPKNWKPHKAEYGAHGMDGNGREVNRLCLYIRGSQEYSLITEITLSKDK